MSRYKHILITVTVNNLSSNGTDLPFEKAANFSKITSTIIGIEFWDVPN
jgi:hypothetical protein